jgi:hypothetical protein
MKSKHGEKIHSMLKNTACARTQVFADASLSCSAPPTRGPASVLAASASAPAQRRIRPRPPHLHYSRHACFRVMKLHSIHLAPQPRHFVVSSYGSSLSSSSFKITLNLSLFAHLHHPEVHLKRFSANFFSCNSSTTLSCIWSW